MPWLRFTSDFDFKPTARVTIACRAGDVKNVTRACAAKALARGVAVRIDPPGKAKRS